MHRDLKPSKIMLTENGLVKVLDFGLAKFLPIGIDDHAGVSETLPLQNTGTATREGTLIGTIAYMSPEQAQGLPLDSRSDIFSFGAVLYELVTGQPPFQGSSKLSILTSILRDNPPPLRHRVANALNELEAIVNRCLDKAPDRRFQSFADFRTASICQSAIVVVVPR